MLNFKLKIAWKYQCYSNNYEKRWKLVRVDGGICSLRKFWKYGAIWIILKCNLVKFQGKNGLKISMFIATKKGGTGACSSGVWNKESTIMYIKRRKLCLLKVYGGMLPWKIVKKLDQTCCILKCISSKF